MNSNTTRKLCSMITIFALIAGQIMPSRVYAQGVLNLPIPGAMIPLSISYNPALVKGITLYPDNPLKFDFIIDPGDDHLQGEALKDEAKKLIKYFMASLTVPEEEMWVNLSPYEKDRIIAHGLSQTELGRDLLAQDYILKQLTASLLYPEEELGNVFWERVYAKAYEQYGFSKIPMNTFNKVWIIPEKANVYVNGNNIFVVDNHLKVMLEADYEALNQSSAISHQPSDDRLTTESRKLRADDLELSDQILREIIIPAIEQEVNEGKNFANLRQIFNSMILATWYKQNLKESLLGQVYANQNKIKGIDLEDKHVKEKIYKQYIAAFEKGVYNYIKEDYDRVTKQMIPRKYFSGGFAGDQLGKVGSSPVTPSLSNQSMVVTVENQGVEVVLPSNGAGPMLSSSPLEFVQYFGQAEAALALRFIAGTDDISRIQSFETHEVKNSRFGRGLYSLTYLHKLILKNGQTYEFYTKQIVSTEESDLKSYSEELKILKTEGRFLNIAYQLNRASESLYLENASILISRVDEGEPFVTRESMQAYLQFGQVDIRDQHKKEVVRRFPYFEQIVQIYLGSFYGLGQLHANDVLHFDLRFPTDHIRIHTNEDGSYHISFIDFGEGARTYVFVLQELKEDKKYELDTLLSQFDIFFKIYGILQGEDENEKRLAEIEAYQRRFEEAYHQGIEHSTSSSLDGIDANLNNEASAEAIEADETHGVNAVSSPISDQAMVRMTLEDVIRDLAYYGISTGSWKFLESEFTSQRTAEKLIEAIESRGIEVPAADTPIARLNQLLEQRDLVRSIPIQDGEVSRVFSESEHWDLGEIIRRNRIFIDSYFRENVGEREHVESITDNSIIQNVIRFLNELPMMGVTIFYGSGKFVLAIDREGVVTKISTENTVEIVLELFNYLIRNQIIQVETHDGYETGARLAFKVSEGYQDRSGSLDQHVYHIPHIQGFDDYTNVITAESLSLEQQIRLIGYVLEKLLESDDDAETLQSKIDHYKTMLQNHQLVKAQLIGEIETNDGKITFRDFMETSLYSKHGYYSGGTIRLGVSHHDFTTESESQRLAAAKVLDMVEKWELLGRPRTFSSIEMGAGNGTLAANVLEGLEEHHKDLFAVLDYVIVEKSPALVARQKASILTKFIELGIDTAPPIRWINATALDLSELEDIENGMFFSYELPDAFSIHRIKFVESKAYEIYVTYADGEFKEALGELSNDEVRAYVATLDAKALNGKTIPFNPSVDLWQAAIAKKLKRGFVLTFDYGGVLDEIVKFDSEFGARTYGNNDPHDFYARVGAQDITSHVNFSQIHKAGVNNGLSTLGYTWYFVYLYNQGVISRQELEENQHRDGIKVLAQSKGILPDVHLAGFAQEGNQVYAEIMYNADDGVKFQLSLLFGPSGSFDENMAVSVSRSQSIGAENGEGNLESFVSAITDYFQRHPEQQSQWHLTFESFSSAFLSVLELDGNGRPEIIHKFIFGLDKTGELIVKPVDTANFAQFASSPVQEVDDNSLRPNNRGIPETSSTIRDRAMVSMTLEDVIRDLAYYGISTGSWKFAKGEFRGDQTPTRLIQALESNGVEVPAADTSIERLNLLLEERNLPQLMSIQDDELKRILNESEHWDLGHIIKRNRILLRMHYGVSTPDKYVESITDSFMLRNFVEFLNESSAINVTILYDLEKFILVIDGEGSVTEISVENTVEIVRELFNYLINNQIIQVEIHKDAYGYERLAFDVSKNYQEGLILTSLGEHFFSIPSIRDFDSYEQVITAKKLSVEQQSRLIGYILERFLESDDDQETFQSKIDHYKTMFKNHQLVKEQLIGDIETNSGRITFRRFMETSLYSKYGYYSGGTTRINEPGTFHDFMTESERPKLANAMVSNMIEAWELLGKPKKFSFIEMGAGNGTLAANILERLEKHHKDLFVALDYVIVEKSPNFVARQKKTVEDKFSKRGIAPPIRWIHTTALDLSELEDIANGMFASHELPDAFSIHRIKFVDSQPYEIYATYADGKFQEQLGALSNDEVRTYVATLNPKALNGKTIPFNPSLDLWQAAIAKKLKKGFVLTFDYGSTLEEIVKVDGAFGARTYGNNKNRHDFYTRVGANDITSDINFPQVHKAGVRNGLVTLGYTWYLVYLYNQGLISRQEMEDNKRKRGMKVLAQSKGIAPDIHLTGFAQTGNQTYAEIMYHTDDVIKLQFAGRPGEDSEMAVTRSQLLGETETDFFTGVRMGNTGKYLNEHPEKKSEWQLTLDSFSTAFLSVLELDRDERPEVIREFVLSLDEAMNRVIEPADTADYAQSSSPVTPVLRTKEVSTSSGVVLGLATENFEREVNGYTLESVRTNAWRPKFTYWWKNERVNKVVKRIGLIRDVVPPELPVVQVSERGLIFPEKPNEVVFKNSELVQKLRNLGIEMLMGEALSNKQFLKDLSLKGEDEIKQFIQVEGVYEINISEPEVEESSELVDIAKNILHRILGNLEDQFPQTTTTFIPLVVNLLSYVSPEDLNDFVSRMQSEISENKIGEFLEIYSSPNRGYFVHRMIIFLSQWAEAARRVFIASEGDRIIMKHVLHPNWFVSAFRNSSEAVGYALGNMITQWEKLDNPNTAGAYLSLETVTNINFINPSIYADHDWRRNFVCNIMFEMVDLNVFSPMRGMLLDLLSSGEINFHGKAYKVNRTRTLVDDVQAGEVTGKNPIMMIEMEDEHGNEKSILAKWTALQDAKNDKIATSISEILGVSSYHIEVFDSFGDEVSPYVWELIEYKPNDMIAFRTNSLFNPQFIFTEQSERVFDGARDVVTNRLRGLGAIFAVEYLLDARDAKMGHILLSKESKEFFRIDWEYLLDYESPENPQIPSVLKGDERDYLKYLSDVRENVEAVVKGLSDTLSLARSRQNELITIIEENLPQEKVESVRDHFTHRVSKTTDEILNELGLSDHVGGTKGSSPINSPGGIDLNPNNLDLNVEGDEIKIDLSNPQMRNNISVDGFIPVIINVAPITNIPMLLGFDTKSSNELMSSTDSDPLSDERCPGVPSSESTDACVGRDPEV